MRSTTKKRADSGFTLVEVMVALGIAAGSLVLILSANTASLRKSVQSRLDERMIRAAESKLVEWQAGIERGAEGPLPGFDRHRWELRVSREELAPLRKLSRATLRVVDPSNKPLLEWSVLHYENLP